MKKVFLIFAISLISSSLFAAQIVSVVFSKNITKDFEPIGITDVFTTDAPKIHCVIKIRNGRKGSVVEGVWVSVDAIDIPNYAIDSAKVKLPGNDASVHFSISKPNNDWPAGNYKLKIYINDTYITYAPFKIVKPNPLEKLNIKPEKHIKKPNHNRIVGKWNCSMWYMGQNVGNGIFEFGSDGKAIISGKSMKYSTERRNILKIYDRTGVSEYTYKISGNNLNIKYPDGATFNCVKTSNIRTPYATRNNNQTEHFAQNNANNRYAQKQNNYPSNNEQNRYANQYGTEHFAQNNTEQFAQNRSNNRRAQSMNSSQNWQLQGTFCTWSGSSYGSNSYSNTKYISFDGNGRWTYGESSSFSGGAGMYAGRGGQDSGSYRVQGNQIYYKTDYGEQGTAQVHMRQNNGRITEIMVDGKLYSPALCN